MARVWRLLDDGAAAGAWNMGVDEALLASARAGGPPTLRLYHWQGPWLSLGYAQRLSERRRDACARAGVGVVRRPTGGAAVLHGVDLTYAVAAPEAALPAGLRATYEVLSRALRSGLARLGVAAEPHAAADRGAGREFDCFATPALDELCVGSQKLVGSAQRRAGGGVLQHGSLCLAPAAAGALGASGLTASGATSLSELGCRVAPVALRAALVEGFARVLEVSFEPGGLAPEEERAAASRGAEPERREPDAA